MQDWEVALSIFLGAWKEKEGFAGALVCGSYVTGEPTEHSDINVHVVLAEGTEWREKGYKIIDGFLIEYWANPPSQIRNYFVSDFNENKRNAATQFATGKIILDKDGSVEQLKSEAKRWLYKTFPKPDAVWTETSKRLIWSSLDNLTDSYKQESPDFCYMYHQTLRQLYELYAKYLGQSIINYSKQYKCLYNPEEARHKYMIPNFPDGEFLEIFSRAIMETNSARMIGRAEEATEYVLHEMGGFIIDGWTLRTPAEN